MAEGMVVGRGLIEILPDFRKWGRQLAADMRLARTQMDGSAAGLRASAATVGASMAKVGKGASLVGLGVAVAATKMAGDFQAETAVLQTAAGETTSGLKIVRKGILGISEGTGTGIKNLTDGMYQIEKAGFRGKGGLEVLRAAAQGAREENAKLSDVTNAMTSVMASYHLKSSDSVRVMNAMKTAAGEGKITMEEFSGALSTVLPIASANKISLEQVTGSMATLTQHGTSAREATHELAATIRALASPNNVASREMARFGLSSVDVSTKLGKRGLTGTFDLLTNTILRKMGPSGKILLSAFEGTKQSAEDARIMLGKIPPELQKQAKAFLAGKIEADDWNATVKGAGVAVTPMMKNFTTLVNRSRGFSRELKSGGPAAKTYTDALKKMAGGAIGLNTILQVTGESTEGNKERVKKIGESFHNASKDVEGWKITQNLLNVQLDMAKQRMQVLMISIGTKLIPVVTRIVKLFTEHKTVTMALVFGLLSLVGVLSAAYVISKLWAVGTAIATAAMFAWNVATMAETESMAIMRAQLAVLWVMQKAQAIATGIATAAQWAWNVAMDANPIALIVIGIAALIAVIVLVATKTQFFQKLWHAMWGGIKTVTLGFVHWLKSNWQLVVWTILTGGIGLAVAMIVRHWEGVKQAFHATIDWIKHNWPLILAILTGPIGLATLYIIRHWKQISDGARDAFHAVIDFVVRMGKDIGTFFSKLPGQLGKFFSKLPGEVGHWFVETGKAIGSFFTKLPGQINRTTNSFNKTLYHVGVDLITGLFKGASDFFTKTVPNFFTKTIWHGLVSFFKAVFGIHSPSTVYAAIGVDLMLGLLHGMLKIASGLTGWITAHVYRPVVNFFKNAPSWLYQRGRDTFLGLLRGWISITNTINGWINSHVLRPVLNFFRNAPSWLYTRGRDTFLGLLRGWIAITNTINGWLRSHVYNPVIGFFRNTGTWLTQRGRDMINGLLNGAKALWGIASTWLRGRGSATVSAIGKLGTLLAQKGRDVINGFLGGMKSVWDDLTKWVSGIAKWIKDHKGPISLDRRLLTPAGRALMHGLLHGLKIGFKGVGSFVYGTGNTIADIIGKIKNSLASVGSALGLGNPKAVGGAQQYAQMYMKAMGWGPSQWPALKALWNGESGWNPLAHNASSGAHGIPQSLPASKMRSEGADYMTNAATQIRWGEKYIRSVYGNPVNAYTKWLHRSPHWYDQGGIARHVGAMFKNTNQPERVLSPRQTKAFERLVDQLPLTAAGGGKTTVVNATFENHGVIGSRHEVENWLVDSLDQLKRRGRI
jgi:TP901 family phage tail tape measure protein